MGDNITQTEDHIFHISEKELKKMIAKKVIEKFKEILPSIKKDIFESLSVSFKQEENKKEKKSFSKPENKEKMESTITLEDIHKFTVPQFKTFISVNNIILPTKGSGTSGNYLKKDYLTASINFYNEQNKNGNLSDVKNLEGRTSTKKKAAPSKKEEKFVLPKGASFIVDDETGSYLGVTLSDGEISPFKPGDGKLLEKEGIKLYHVEVLGRSISKPTTKDEIDEFLSEEPEEEEPLEEEPEEDNIVFEKEPLEEEPEEDNIVFEEEPLEEEPEEDNIVFEEEVELPEEEIIIEEREEEIIQPSSEKKAKQKDSILKTEENILKAMEKDITEEQFKRYEDVRQSRKVQMNDIIAVSKATNLSDTEIKTITLKYSELKNRYPRISVQVKNNSSTSKQRKLLKKKV